MSNLRAALIKQLEFWEGCLKRPLYARCEQCPDGDYEMDVATRVEKRKTGKMIWKRTQYVEQEVDEEISYATYKCNKCGHERGDGPITIGPLFSCGGAMELDNVCKELRKLLEENP